MKSFFERLSGGLRKDESGFTLIEMLIVVAIIVALAAAIVPQVVQFGDTGTKGEKVTENEAVETAMNAMLAETLAGTVTAVTTVGVNDWSTKPAGGTKVVALFPRYFPTPAPHTTTATARPEDSPSRTMTA